ncbi:MAG: phosphate transport system permease protein [Frankiaceae bacterium]|nr:phosphate transport system permease protein [Frankiaceae bacterium]
MSLQPATREGWRNVPASRGVLSRSTAPAVLAGSLVAGAVVMSIVGFNWYGVALLAFALNLVGIYTLSRRVEGSRKAKDRLVTAVISSSFVLAVVPLVSLLVTVVANGWHRLDIELFSSDMRNVLGPGGGIKHALIGTLLITAVAALMSVPIGVLTAIYLVEYGRGRLSKLVTFLVDVMTGIPSIVAGLFAVALFSIFLGLGVRIGFGGSVALSVLMIPIVVRSTEEMLRLVPHELREASYALGVPKWRTVVKVVLPTSVAGIVTGITLAIARVVGETAPLLVIAGFTQSTNTNIFSGRMMTLPVFVFNSFTQPGSPRSEGIDRAWSAALALIAVVMLLNLAARLISRYFSPKTR